MQSSTISIWNTILKLIVCSCLFLLKLNVSGMLKETLVVSALPLLLLILICYLFCFINLFLIINSGDKSAFANHLYLPSKLACSALKPAIYCCFKQHRLLAVQHVSNLDFKSQLQVFLYHGNMVCEALLIKQHATFKSLLKEGGRWWAQVSMDTLQFRESARDDF